MTIGPQTQTVIDQFRDLTTQIGDYIALLIAEKDMTPAEQAEWDNVISALRVAGTNPNNPTPAFKAATSNRPR